MDRVKSLINTLSSACENGAGAEVLLQLTDELRTTLQQQLPVQQKRPDISVWMPGSLPRPHVQQPPKESPARTVSHSGYAVPRPPRQVFQTESETKVEAEAKVEVASNIEETMEAKLTASAEAVAPGVTETSKPVAAETIIPAVAAAGNVAPPVQEIPSWAKLPVQSVMFPATVDEVPAPPENYPAEDLPSIMELCVEETEDEDLPPMTNPPSIAEEKWLGETIPDRGLSMEEIWQQATTKVPQAPVVRELNERIAQRTVALNEVFSKRDTELVEVLAQPRIADLRKAISINDKYQYIDSLFRGDEDMFERSLKTLNNFGSYTEAQYWMQRELTIKLGWNDQDDLVQRFCQLVARRFS